MDTAPITIADIADDMKWLFEDPEPEDPHTSTWEEFLKLDLTGCSVNFGCQGGDMYQITGTIVQVYKEGDSIKIKLRNAEISPEDPDEREKEGITERHEEIVVELETCWPPIIRPEIVVSNCGLRELPGWTLNSGFSCGFIFRNARRV